MNESEKQFSFTRAASSTSGRTKNQIPISQFTSTVRVKLYKGNIMCAGRKSPISLYNPAIATMEADPTKAYNQDDATGFIRLNALRLKVAARVQGRTRSSKQV
jgi:argininosuccinate synthase